MPHVTRLLVSEQSGLPINVVTPTVHKLVAAGIIEERPSKPCPITKRRAMGLVLR